MANKLKVHLEVGTLGKVACDYTPRPKLQAWPMTKELKKVTCGTCKQMPAYAHEQKRERENAS